MILVSILQAVDMMLHTYIHSSLLVVRYIISKYYINYRYENVHHCYYYQQQIVSVGL